MFIRLATEVMMQHCGDIFLHLTKKLIFNEMQKFLMGLKKNGEV